MGVDEELDDVGMTLGGRPHERGLVMLALAGVHVGAAGEERFHRSEVARPGAGHQHRLAFFDDGISIESAKALSFKAKTDITTEGNNISSKAQMSFKAEGTSGIELKSSATAVLKGSLVQIN